MPSCHAPIKKYNYERSLFRWVMSRHPEPFEKRGITTKILERAPLAREAFYRSDWPGARALVQSNDESKYERTVFFDTIIERGLRDGTRFSVEHVTSDERSKLGITMDRATGKYYLHAFGSAKARRISARRGSATSSDLSDSEHQHPVIKQLGDVLASEIEAAGEDPDVRLDQSRFEPGSVRGSMVLTFSVVIQRRKTAAGAHLLEGDGGGGGGGNVGMSVPGRVGGGGGGATADAGGGVPSGGGTPQQHQQQQQAERPAMAVESPPSSSRNTHIDAGARQHEQRLQLQVLHQQQRRDGPTAKVSQQLLQQQQQQRDKKRNSASVMEAAAAALASVAQGGGKQHKPRGKPKISPNAGGSSILGAGPVESGTLRVSIAGGHGSAEAPPKKRKSIAQTVFSRGNALKMEPVPQIPVSSALGGGGSGGGGGGGSFSRMNATYATSSSSLDVGKIGGGSGSSNHGWARSQPRQPTLPAFGGGNVNGTRSFLPGMGLEGIFPVSSISSSSASAPSSSSSSSPPSTPRQHGGAAPCEGEGGKARGAVQRPQAFQSGWAFAQGTSGNFSGFRTAEGAAGGSGPSAHSSGGGGDLDGSGTSSSSSPPLVPSSSSSSTPPSWELYSSSGFMRDDNEFESHQQHQNAATTNETLGRVADLAGAEAGGGANTEGGPGASGLLPSLSQQRFAGGMAALVDHQASLKPCTPYTKLQQSLSRQAAGGGGGSGGTGTGAGNGTGGSTHGVWGGTGVGTGEASPSATPSTSAAPGTCVGTIQDDRELDFLEMFF